MTIRPATHDDIPVLQTLYTDLLPYIPTSDQLKDVISRATVDVLEIDNAVVAFRVISQRKTMPNEQAFVWIAVLPAVRQQGIGGQLLSKTLKEMPQLGYLELITQVKDNNQGGLALCKAFNVDLHRHMIRMQLDLTRWQATPKALQRTDGIQIRTLAAIGTSEANKRRFYALNKTLSATIPIDEPEDFPDYEAYATRRLSGEHFPYKGDFIAIDGDAWIGLSQISLHEQFAFVEMTGVLPDYRGRGIAQTLKAQSLQFAKDRGYENVRTVNDVGNAPMVAVNEKVGFVKDGGVYHGRLRLI